MKRKITVTIGTAAFNEAKNVGAMLSSVLSQSENTISIKKILVSSDGSTDKTVKIVKSFKDRRISVLAHTIRKGQPTRINEILQRSKTDYLVILDADTVLGSSKAIENILKPFARDNRIGVVAGNTIPVPGHTFLEKAANNYIYARQALQKKYNFGKKALVAHAYLAFSRRFLLEYHLPREVMNGDAYSYFESIRRGFKFSYAHNSVVYYRSPSTIKEYVKQKTRQIAGGRQLEQYFGHSAVADGLSVPYPIMKEILRYQLRKNLLGYVLVKILFGYSGYKSKSLAEALTTTWEIAGTTKGLITL